MRKLLLFAVSVALLTLAEANLNEPAFSAGSFLFGTEEFYQYLCDTSPGLWRRSVTATNQARCSNLRDFFCQEGFVQVESPFHEIENHHDYANERIAAYHYRGGNHPCHLLFPSGCIVV